MNKHQRVKVVGYELWDGSCYKGMKGVIVDAPIEYENFTGVWVVLDTPQRKMLMMFNELALEVLL